MAARTWKIDLGHELNTDINATDGGAHSNNGHGESRAFIVSRKAWAALLVMIGALLTWAVLTKSLPYTLAETHPELALRFDPNNPVALITLAERARTKVIALTKQEAVAKGSASIVGADPFEQAVTTRPAMTTDADSVAAEADGLRQEIRDLSRRAIATDPLNARAFRLLGEVSDIPEQKRLFINDAFIRSRRESIAALWLMADSFELKKFTDVVEKAEVLLRTAAGHNYTAEVMRYLAMLAELPEGRIALAAALAQKPAWRPQFFDALPKNVQYAGTPFELVVVLQEAGSTPSALELAPYLTLLMRENLVSYAHDIWIQLPTNQQRASTPLLNNANFVTEPSGLPFDWLVKRGTSARVEFFSLADGAGGRSMQFSFDGARIQFPELSQVLVLGPGRYQLSGEFKGMINARRGLRWEFGCWQGKLLAQTEMLHGRPGEVWQPFALEVEIPDLDDCRSQQLRLFHDQRSVSEQLASGQMSFRRLNLDGVPQ